jgi:phosphoglycolate phosphatase
MNYQYLLFDLDGTISDPKQGITNCLNYALASFDLPQHPPDTLAQFIGPPLDYSFRQLVGERNPEFIGALVAKYRERYAEIGYRENALYPGIVSALTELHQHAGVVIGLCTSKRADFAHKILELFNLSHFFTFVSGGDVGVEKSSQIGALLDAGTINASTLMIGDRHFDLAAAQAHAIDGAGVLWGYGSEAELKPFNPVFLLQHTHELLPALLYRGQ